jgi:hypothetical protein
MPAARDSKGKFTSNGDSTGYTLSYEERELVRNAVLSRTELIKHWMDPRRSVDDECGYPATEELTIENYKHLYNREPIATKTVNVLPRECWRSTPEVVEVANSEEETEFETAWKDLGKGLNLETETKDEEQASWFEDEEEGSSPIWEYLERADRLSGIGHYGVILLGLDDVKTPTDLLNPVKLTKGGSVGRKLLFMRVLDESLARISSWEEDENSIRHGRPKTYSLLLANNQVGTLVHPVSQNMTQTEVHWSRVVHLADNLESSEIIGVPRMRPVINRLLDLYKMYGGSAEMYWRGAFPGLVAESQPQLIGKTNLDVAGLRDTMENYSNSLQRILAATGFTFKTLAPTVVDPTGQIKILIEAICIELDIPIRVFMGSERGELASTQDADSWERRLDRRRLKYITPRIIVPFIDRLIRIGVLPVPKQYTVKWSKEDTMTPGEKADRLVKRTQAYAAYISGGVEALMPPHDYLVREAEYSDEEATAILESALEHMEEVEEKQAEQQEEQFAKQLELEEAKKPPQLPPGQGPPNQQGKPQQQQPPNQDDEVQ